MGKSEIAKMPICRQDNEFVACQLNGTSEVKKTPENMQVFQHQVAGHVDNGKSVGMIKNGNTVLKPITNRKYFEREVEFYESLERTNDQCLLELKEFLPKYYGKVKMPINGQNYDFIILEDLTQNYKEPCILDAKIGKRTWDPEATYEKIMKEEGKYLESKRDLSFCIPGFQVFQLYTNQLCKFDKEFGKNLNKETVLQALKTFLNGNSSLCRCLIVQFLTCLWRIQHWVRNQRHYQFFSSSLLFVYDARRLRELIKTQNTLITLPKVQLNRMTSLYRPLSLAVLNEKIPTGFSGQLTTDGPILKAPVKYKYFDTSTNNKQNYNMNNLWKMSIRSLKRTHSFQNDYDKDMLNKKQDYTYILEELVTEQKSELWATVKMIDFAHVFRNDKRVIDQNYLEGIDNLVKIFEDFLMECN